MTPPARQAPSLIPPPCKARRLLPFPFPLPFLPLLASIRICSFLSSPKKGLDPRLRMLGMTEKKIPAPAGVAAPRSRNFYMGARTVLSVAERSRRKRSEFHSPSNRDWGKGTPLGPRPGANGFGSFCRNKRACPELVEGTSSCGDETPHKKTKTLDSRSEPVLDVCNRGSGMTAGEGS